MYIESIKGLAKLLADLEAAFKLSAKVLQKAIHLRWVQGLPQLEMESDKALGQLLRERLAASFPLAKVFFLVRKVLA